MNNSVVVINYYILSGILCSEEFQIDVDKSEESVLSEKSIDVVCKEYNQMNLEYQENEGGSSKDSSTLTLPDWERTCSPFEIRISDWIAELQKDQSSEKEYEQECHSTHSTKSYPTWFGSDSDYDTWAYSGFLWDM